MPKDFSEYYPDRYEAYFDSNGKLIDSDISPQTVEATISDLRGSPVSERGRTIIQDVSDSRIRVRVHGSKFNTIRLREIVDADKIIRFHLRKGQYPVSNTSNPNQCDFRNPSKEIGVEPVLANSYAPRLAELVRKSMRTKQIKAIQIILEPDVAQYFPDTESVNKTLRDLIKIFRRINT